MQRFVRRLAFMGLASVAIASGTFLTADSALALSEQEILEKLDSIPVFLIVDSEGQTLTANVETEESAVQVPIVFLNSAEAENFLEDAESGGAELADDAQIAVLPLGDVYAEANSQLESPNSLVYIPDSTSVNQAAQIAEQDVQGVPLYAAVDLEREQYLLTGDNTLPMFFSLADLQAQVSSLVENNPDIQDAIGVEVTTLETMLVNMAADNPEVDELLELVQFIPSSQTLQYIQSLSEQGGAGAAGE